MDSPQRSDILFINPPSAFRLNRRFYLNPQYLKMRITKSLRDKTFWRDVYYGFKTFLPDLFNVLRLKKNEQ
jgi:hypothetical protein